MKVIQNLSAIFLFLCLSLISALNSFSQCGANITYCYGIDELSTWTYTDDMMLGVIGVSFNQGELEPGNWDQFAIYNGPDNTYPLLYSNSYGTTTDLSGMSWFATGNTITIEIISDGSGSCQSSNYIEWNYDIVCELEEPGCTNPIACNFNSQANTDDGSCEYITCAGCNDLNACNYDSTSTLNDGTCEYVSCAGCTDSEACNYDSEATLNNGACDYSCYGCLDPSACNYDSTISIDDGSCCSSSCATLSVNGGSFQSEISWILYESDGETEIFSGGAPFSDILCIPDGCYVIELMDSFGDGWTGNTYTFTDSFGNVLSSGTLGDYQSYDMQNIVIGGVLGCTVIDASNYDPVALCDDGSCLFCDPNEQVVTIDMMHSYGNGWNGAHYMIIDEFGNIAAMGCLDNGYFGTDQFCLATGCYSIQVGGGSWDEDISWTLYNQADESLFSDEPATDGSQLGFPLGGANCFIYGCINIDCNNYNPYAIYDDGSCVCPPDNDDCQNAEAVICNYSISGTTINANDNEELIGNTCGPAIDGPGVWYVFNGNGNQVFIETCNTESGYDTRISLFEGYCGNLTCVAGNEDACPGFLSSVAWNTSLGVDVYILVHGFGGSTGDFELDISCMDCASDTPENDDCVNAIELEDGIPVEGSSCCASFDNYNPCSSPFNTSYGTWFKINSESADSFHFLLENGSGANVGMMIAEDEGNLGCENINAIACCPLVSGACEGDFSDFFMLEPNTDYYFMVYTNDPVNCGTFNLTVTQVLFGCIDPFANNYNSQANTDDGSCAFSALPPNDDCSDAIELTCGETIIGTTGIAQSYGPSNVTDCSSFTGLGVWYTYTGTGEFHNLSTCGSSADTEVNIYLSDDNSCDGTFSCASDGLDGFLSEIDDNTSNTGCGFFDQDNIYMDFVSIPDEVYFIFVGGSQGIHMITLTCETSISGCTNSAACNYDSTANADDGSCDYFSCLCTACDPGPGIGLNMEMFDSFGDGWNGATYQITDGFGNLVYSGDIDSAMSGTDEDNFSGNEYGNDWFCSCDDGCYRIIVGGGVWDSNISWNLWDENGNLVLSGTAPETQYFTFGDVNCGCTDPGSCSYESTATTEDGSCDYLSCSGCTDPTACNFDYSAIINDGSCCYDNCVMLSMSDSFGDGWGGAIYEIYNASTDISLVYGSLDNAQAGDGLTSGIDTLCLSDGCYYINVGGGDFDVEISWEFIDGVNEFIQGGAPVSGIYFSVGSGECYSCKEINACNYDPNTPLEDCSLCDFTSCLGCTYPESYMFDYNATIDDGTCIVIPFVCSVGDFNNDYVVNMADLLILLGTMGEFCPE